MIQSGVSYAKQILSPIKMAVSYAYNVLIHRYWNTRPPKAYQVIKIDCSPHLAHYFAERGLYEGVMIICLQHNTIMVLNGHLIIRFNNDVHLRLKVYENHL